jgi:hypothetical protein
VLIIDLPADLHQKSPPAERGRRLRNASPPAMGGGEHMGNRQGSKRIRPLWSWVKENRSKWIFFYFNSGRTLLEFSRRKYDEFFNSILTKILQMKAGFLGFLFQIFLKFQIQPVGFL